MRLQKVVLNRKCLLLGYSRQIINMKDRFCDHEFFSVKNDVHYDGRGKQVPNSIHAVVSCVHCGHIRHLYADGVVEIVLEQGRIIKPNASTDNEPIPNG